MNLKLNISKQGLSTTEGVINEEYTLNYGHIFRGLSAYEQAVQGGYVGSKQEFSQRLGKINKMVTTDDIVHDFDEDSSDENSPMSAELGNILYHSKIEEVEYNSVLKALVFYADKNKTKSVTSISAKPFIKDGMIDKVSINPETQIITITFNTDAGKEDIQVDLATIFSQKMDIVQGHRDYIPKLGEDGQLSPSNYTEDDLREMDNRHRIISYELAESEDYTELFSINDDLAGSLQTGNWRMSVPSGVITELLPASVDIEEKDDTVWATFTAQQISDKSTESAKIYLRTIYRVVFNVDTDTNKWVCVTRDKKDLYPTIIVPDSINEGDSMMQEYMDIVYSNMPVIMQIYYEGKVISAPVNFSAEEESGTQVVKFTGVGHIGNETYTQTITCDANFVVIEVGEVKKGGEIQKDGYYPAMTVGKAENLVGRGESTEEEFSFRPSAGSLSIEDGSAKITSIKGNSVVWNQVMPTTNATLSTSPISSIRENGIVTCNGTTLSTGTGGIGIGQFVANDVGHKYLFICNIISNEGDSVEGKLFFLANRSDYSAQKRIKDGFASFVYENTETESSKGRGIAILGGNNFVVTNLKLRVRQIDLTQMFGAEVAEVIATSGDPIAEYRQRKPMNIADEYAHKTGTIVDMRVSEIKSVGDNAYNPELGYARVLGGKEYNIYFSVEGLYEMYFSRTLEEDKEPIDAISNPMTFPADGYVWIMGMNGEPLQSDKVCICLQHSYPKPVIPYVQDVKDLSFISELFPNGMRSAGNVCDEIRYDKATQKWQKIERVGVRAYEEGDAENSDVTTDGVTTYYALANPKPEDLDIDLTPYYEIWDFGTEEAIASGASTPFRADIIYQFNAVDRIRNNSTKIEELEAKIQSLTLAISALQTNE